MGWASGGELLDELWGEVREYLPPEVRMEVAKKFYVAFSNADCDVIGESDHEELALMAAYDHWLTYPQYRENDEWERTMLQDVQALGIDEVFT